MTSVKSQLSNQFAHLKYNLCVCSKHLIPIHTNDLVPLRNMHTVKIIRNGTAELPQFTKTGTV